MRTTTNYGLPIFEPGENPAWVGDWNSTMEKIDNISGGGGGSGGSSLSVIFSDFIENPVSQENDHWHMPIPSALSNYGSTWLDVLEALLNGKTRVTLTMRCQFSPNPNVTEYCFVSLSFTEEQLNLSYPGVNFQDYGICMTDETFGGNKGKPRYFRMMLDPSTAYIDMSAYDLELSDEAAVVNYYTLSYLTVTVE